MDLDLLIRAVKGEITVTERELGRMRTALLHMEQVRAHLNHHKAAPPPRAGKAERQRSEPALTGQPLRHQIGRTEP